MLDLSKESFDYNGWHFEFLHNPSDEWTIDVVIKKGKYAIVNHIVVERLAPLYIETFGIVEYLQRQEDLKKKAVDMYKEHIINGGKPYDRNS